MGLMVPAILAVLAFFFGFASVATALDVTQPASQDMATVVDFQVGPADAAGTVADHLQQQGLIRSALLFRILAKVRQLDSHLQPGTYALSPSMSMSTILARLLSGHPDVPLIIVPAGKQLVIIPPGLRATQYLTYFKGLSNFNAKSFVKIARTGVLPDGKRLASQYWYLPPASSAVYYALEGYLFPGMYIVDDAATEVDVINLLLTTMGERLCRGPSGQPDAYLHDRAQCEAHAAVVQVGSANVSIFAEAEHRYATSNDVSALYDAVTMGSLVARLTPLDSEAQGVADVYFNRYIAGLHHHFDPAGDYVQNLGSDASAQYAQDSDNPPANGGWWAPLTAPAANVDWNNPYNTAVRGNVGLPPGPIAAASWAEIVAAARADDPTDSPYFFVVADRCGHAKYARSFLEFQQTMQQANAGC
jgi:UPF0755 protein